MGNKSKHGVGATLATIAREAYAATLGNIGPLVLATLQRLYDAHIERELMRLAPEPGHSRRAAEHRRSLGL
jgi:hypothetical protein